LQGARGVGGLVAIKPTGTNTLFVAFDGNGNVTGLIDATTGTSSGQLEYGPFGETIRLTPNANNQSPFRFSTKYTDEESDFLYYGFRYYNPSTGRWLSRDPIGESITRNLYGFVDNDGINFFDLDGLEKGAEFLMRHKGHGGFNPFTAIRQVAALPFDILSGDIFSTTVIGEKFNNSQCEFLITVTGIRTGRNGNIEFRDRTSKYPEFSHIPSPQAVHNPTFGGGVSDAIQIVGDEIMTIGAVSRKMSGVIEGAYKKALANKCSANCIKIYIEAHSQGGAIANLALELVSSDAKKHVFLTILGGEQDNSGVGLGAARNIHNSKDVVPKFPNQPSKLFRNYPIETFDPASLGFPKGQEDGAISGHTLANDRTGGDGSYYKYRENHPW